MYSFTGFTGSGLYISNPDEISVTTQNTQKISIGDTGVINRYNSQFNRLEKSSTVTAGNALFTINIPASSTCIVKFKIIGFDTSNQYYYSESQLSTNISGTVTISPIIDYLIGLTLPSVYSLSSPGANSVTLTSSTNITFSGYVQAVAAILTLS